LLAFLYNLTPRHDQPRSKMDSIARAAPEAHMF
jgi:hypothetical protein